MVARLAAGLPADKAGQALSIFNYLKTMIKTEIIVHRDQLRIKLDFPYDSSQSNKIKQIEGAVSQKNINHK